MARIRNGTMVGQDHRYFQVMGDTNAGKKILDTEFAIDHIGLQRVSLTAAGYGMLGGTNNYGNGALYVNLEDIAITPDEASHVLSELAKIHMENMKKCRDSLSRALEDAAKAQAAFDRATKSVKAVRAD